MTSSATVYYSYTGNTCALAEEIHKRVDGELFRIEPATERSYPNWLLRSVTPGSTVPIKSEPGLTSEFDPVFLGTPKWTFSCPPVNQWIQKAAIGGSSTGLFVTHAGFMVDSFVRRLSRRIQRQGARVEAVLEVHRDEVDSELDDACISRFVRRVTGDGDGITDR